MRNSWGEFFYRKRVWILDGILNIFPENSISDTARGRYLKGRQKATLSLPKKPTKYSRQVVEGYVEEEDYYQDEKWKYEFFHRLRLHRLLTHHFHK